MKRVLEIIGLITMIFLTATAVRADNRESDARKNANMGSAIESMADAMEKKQEKRSEARLSANLGSAIQGSGNNRCDFAVEQKFSTNEDGSVKDFKLNCKCLDECFDAVTDRAENEICLNVEERCMS